MTLRGDGHGSCDCAALDTRLAIGANYEALCACVDQTLAAFTARRLCRWNQRAVLPAG
jgi:hypothetical protein